MNAYKSTRRTAYRKTVDLGRRNASFEDYIDHHLEHNCAIAPNGCITFQGSLTKQGYAFIGYKKKSVLLHRLVLQRKLGRPIRSGYETLHSIGCYSNCINEDHLREGTHEENIDQRRFDGTDTTTLSEDVIHQIDYMKHVENLTKAEISRRFNVDENTVRLILERTGISGGKYYRYVKPMVGPLSQDYSHVNQSCG